MKNTKETKFMVTTEANIRLEFLKQKVRYLAQIKITWEHYSNKKRITQCHRCQGWGNATTNCHVCLKCAQSHLTKDCKKSKDLPAEYVNCGKDHPANASICKAYKKRIEQIDSTKKINNKDRVPPPIHGLVLILVNLTYKSRLSVSQCFTYLRRNTPEDSDGNVPPGCSGMVSGQAISIGSSGPGFGVETGLSRLTFLGLRKFLLDSNLKEL